MGNIKKQYVFKGLDLRTNKLYRQEGTASDCRNVRLDSTRKLIKINDMVESTIPRGVAGATGLFETELPFEAVILDMMPYEDHFVLACKYRHESVPTFYKDVVIFYKWDQTLNTVEKIPFESEVYPSAGIGQILYRNGGDIVGSFQYENIENVLYFIGNEYPAYTLVDPSLNAKDEEFNRSPVFTYDGKVIGRSGCPSFLEDGITEDQGTQTTDEYVRVLPFKIDALGRHTFGNYTTHLGINTNQTPGVDSFIQINQTPTAHTDYTHHAFLDVGAVGIQLNAADSALLRTIPITLYSDGGVYKSAGKGQILYGIKATYQKLNTAIPPTFIYDYTEKYEFYMCTVEDIDYVGNTATLGEFKIYNPDTGLWEDSSIFAHSSDDNSVHGRPQFLSNILYAVYGSDEYTFGYKLKAFTTGAANGAAYNVHYMTDKNESETMFGNEKNPINYDTSLIPLYISEDLDDIIDISTVKLPPPKATSITTYVGSMVLTDETALYFSDFSVGGNIETFTPFDTFSFGSSKRGKVTGVFSNETFLVGYREQESYYITGNIFTANYRIQSYKSTRIGCTDPRSIIDFRGAGVFASEKGVFVSMQGGQMQELSDIIEPLFADDSLSLGLDMYDVKSVIDFKREYLYLAIGGTTPVTLAYSYYHNEWFLYDYIDTSGGFEILDGVLYSSDGTNVFVESSIRKEASAYYRSNFETLGMPSFEKKFLQVLLYTMDATEINTIGIRTYKDWDLTNTITDETKSVIVPQVDITQRFDPSRSKSAAIEINSDSGHALVLNGYEYEYSDDVRMFRSDD